MSEIPSIKLHDVLPEDSTGVIRDKVGEYRVEDIIGVGGEGTVHRARDVRNGNDVAVKLVHHKKPELDTIQLVRGGEPWWEGGQHVVRVIPPEQNRNFDSERDKLLHVHGEDGAANVVGVLMSGRTGRHSLGELPGVSYIATELAQEGALNTLLKARGVFSVCEATGIALQVADALEATHAKRLTYGDLKPGNIFIKSIEGNVPDVVLGDFGVAGPPRKLGAMDYTISYAAPEQFEERVEFASDVYSLGTVLYELQSGQKFFKFRHDQNEAWTRIGLQINQERYDSHVRSRLDILRGSSPETVTLLEDMLQLDPNSRPDITAVKQRLLTINEHYADSNDVILEGALPTVAFSTLPTEKIPVNI